MDLTGKIKNLAVDYFSKKITVTLEINEAERFIKGVDELKKLEKLSIIIKPFRKKKKPVGKRLFPRPGHQNSGESRHEQGRS